MNIKQEKGQVAEKISCPKCVNLREELDRYKDVKGFFEWAIKDAEDENDLVNTIVIWIRTRHLRGIGRFVGFGEFADAAQVKPGTALPGNNVT
ncbi:MAG: hypothetical protein OXI80_19440 [Caldilineaceae bacterium]|nr:hypothetical protein [Caldilineaceae bacterium]